MKEDWQDIVQAKNALLKSLAINLKAIKGVLETDAFNDVLESDEDTKVMEEAITALKNLGETTVVKVESLLQGHSDKKGKVDVGDLHIYMFYAQQYHNLHHDLTAKCIALTKVLINLKERNLNPVSKTVH